MTDDFLSKSLNYHYTCSYVPSFPPSLTPLSLDLVRRLLDGCRRRLSRSVPPSLSPHLPDEVGSDALFLALLLHDPSLVIDVALASGRREAAAAVLSGGNGGREGGTEDEKKIMQAWKELQGERVGT